jgi:hypothetical protein
VSYLIDTSVLIDVARGHPAVSRWWSRQDARRLFTSVITLGELHRGAYARHAREPDRLLRSLREVADIALAPLRGRVLAFDEPAAAIWGRLMGEGEAAGRRPPLDDAKIAAIALRHDLTVASSNLRELASLCPTLDPGTA